MRTILITLILLVALAGCAGKDDGPDAMADNATATEETKQESDEQAAEDGDGEEEKSVVTADLQVGPVGDIRFKDGTAMEITELEKLDKYLVYITGKLNGRSSTVISLTRMDDLKLWKSIVFKDPYTFTIVTKAGKEFNFEDARLYLGSDSHTTYTFYAINPANCSTELVSVEKANIIAININ